MNLLQKFFREEEGANLVEYALLITLIAIVVIIGAGWLGDRINVWFSNLGTKVGVWASGVAS